MLLFRKLIIVIIRLVILSLFGMSVLKGGKYFWHNISTSSHYHIRKIDVKYNTYLKKEQILSLAGVGLDSNLATLKMMKIKKKLEGNPFIKAVRLERELPSKLSIYVEEKKPLAYIYDKKSGFHYLMEDGTSLNRENNHGNLDLPIVYTCKDTLVYNFLKTMTSFSDFFIHNISEIFIENNSIVFYLNNSKSKVIFKKYDFAKQLTILEDYLLCEYDKLRTEEMEYIDLRFDNQVVYKKY